MDPNSKSVVFLRRNPRLLGLLFVIIGLVGTIVLPLEAKEGTSLNLYLIVLAPPFLLLGLAILLAPRSHYEVKDDFPIYSPALKRPINVATVVGFVIGFCLLFGFYHFSLRTGTYNVGH